MRIAGTSRPFSSSAAFRPGGFEPRLEARLLHEVQLRHPAFSTSAEVMRSTFAATTAAHAVAAPSERFTPSKRGPRALFRKVQQLESSSADARAVLQAVLALIYGTLRSVPDRKLARSRRQRSPAAVRAGDPRSCSERLRAVAFPPCWPRSRRRDRTGRRPAGVQRAGCRARASALQRALRSRSASARTGRHRPPQASKHAQHVTQRQVQTKLENEARRGQNLGKPR